METPEKPTLDYSYTAFQQAQGNNSFPGTQLDNDLANLKQAIDGTIDFSRNVIRDDGALANGVVTKASLAADVQVGVLPPRPWLTGTAYAVDDTVSTLNSIFICQMAHTSGVFATDLAAGRWGLIAEFTVPATIADGAVVEAKHATGGVSSRALAAASVTEAKLADAAVTLPKLSGGVQAALMPVGASMGWDGPFAPAGWVFKFGQALSRASYLALFNVLTAAVLGNSTSGSATVTNLPVDLRNLGLEGAAVEGPGVVAGTTVVSLTATTMVLSLNVTATDTGVQFRLFPHGNGDGSSTFNVPDDRDRADVGRGNMGGSAAGRISLSGNGASNLNTARLNGAGGIDRHALSEAQLAPHAHTASASGTVDNHTHTYNEFETFAQGSALGLTTASAVGVRNKLTPSTSGGAAPAISATVTVNSTGSGQPHPNIPPSRVTNKIIYTGVI